MAIAAWAFIGVTPNRGLSQGDGETSELAPLVAQSLLLDAVETEGRSIAVGERGHVLVSRDGGASWEQVLVPTRSTLTAVTAVGAALWAVGHDATILHSGDAGETWVEQYRLSGEDLPLLDVWFADPRHGLAVGAYGLALSTEDGGAHWEKLEIDPEERHLNAIAASAGALYLAGEFGTVFHSADQGRTWTLRPTPYSGSLFGALAAESAAVLVFGLRGHIYRSEDSGRTWVPIDSYTDSTLLGGAELRGATLLIVGHSGTMLVSHDAGRHFEVRNRPDRHALSAALPGANGDVLLFGEDGVRVIDRTELGRSRR